MVIDNNDIEAEDGELFAALRPSGRTFADITSSLELNGVLRPRHAFCNSRA